jgi:FKBP-type peptidyl-prolyl cis-trans isomerase FklB
MNNMKNYSLIPIYFLVTSLMIPLFISSCNQSYTADSAKIISRMDSVSYIVGNNLAYQSVGVDLNPDLIMQGFIDARDTSVKINQSEAARLMNIFRAELVAEQNQRIMQEAVSNEIIGNRFLEENRNKEGVQETASGLQYIVLQEGSGPHPNNNSIVTTRFTGTLIDGTIFDTTEGEGPESGPRNFEVDKVIEGWKEALLQMRPGAKWKLFIPPSLGYGKELRDPIPPNSVLIFELELLDVRL